MNSLNDPAVSGAAFGEVGVLTALAHCLSLFPELWLALGEFVPPNVGAPNVILRALAADAMNKVTANPIHNRIRDFIAPPFRNSLSAIRRPQFALSNSA